MSTEETLADQGIEVRTYFVRGRNAMVARAELSELYAAMYLHQMDWGIRFEPEQDQLLRDGLAAMTLHCASRPRGEITAWTINFQDPRANVFINGDNRLGTVVGNVLTENVKEARRIFSMRIPCPRGNPAAGASSTSRGVMSCAPWRNFIRRASSGRPASSGTTRKIS